jgi:hypothetical protein
MTFLLILSDAVSLVLMYPAPSASTLYHPPTYLWVWAERGDDVDDGGSDGERRPPVPGVAYSLVL